jgi:hypothetical protein
LLYCWLPTIKRSVGNGLDRSESFVVNAITNFGW